MDPHAHRTLELRAFVREFGGSGPPGKYYDYIAGKLSREKLMQDFPEEAEAAMAEAWLAELGNHNSAPADEVDRRVFTTLNGSRKWVLIGGPPCQAYSVIGRSRNAGNSAYDPLQDGRHFLYL
jgi:DNA (cytosine-5)-methyltransferase 1